MVADAPVKKPDAENALKDFGSGDKHPNQESLDEHVGF